MSQEQAKQKIGELIKKYEEVLKSGEVKKYTEEETKKDFILPLFEALGWDVFNKKEVSAEEHIKSSGRVDYGFYVNGRTKFYLEAKPLKADLNDEDFAKQAIRYSWNRGVTWAVLTNFESVKVFNAQAISKYLGDKLYFEMPHSEFLERFDQLWQLSRSEFEHDLINKEAERVGKKLQKISITSLLYEDLNKSREILTKGFTLWNKHLDKDLLDEGVQRLLDRLVFIRVAEDRGIEPPTLQPLLREWKSSPRKEPFFKSLISKFRELDITYNSNLFKPHPFEDWEEYDNVTEEVISIFYGKPGYYEYDFKAIPADILGMVYENYLGYRLSQSKKGLAVAKDIKKRKEQGIYYTPSFIVDYIVKNTLGPVLDRCRSIDDLKKIKVLDPACGSGSFLIKALEVIGDKYKEFNRPVDTYVKIQIITENLYGVDLDEQAVEIARLNLMISALDSRIKFPSLSNNIKNGNSLISGTDEELKKYFGKNYHDKKPFNWQEEFPEVFKQGGFNVVIGNPPWITLRGKEFMGVSEDEIDYYLKEYKHSAEYKINSFALFIETGIKLLSGKGTLGYIVPSTLLANQYLSKIRKYILDTTSIETIVELGKDVFDKAVADTCIVILHRGLSLANDINVISNIEDLSKGLFILKKILQSKYHNNKDFIFETKVNEVEFRITDKIESVSVPLKNFLRNYVGIVTGDNKRFISKTAETNKHKKILIGRDIGRYILKNPQKYVLFDINQLHSNTDEKIYQQNPKILIRKTGSSLFATLDTNKTLTEQTIYNLIPKVPIELSLNLFLALINSRLMQFYFTKKLITNPEAFPYIKGIHIDALPIRLPDLQKESERNLYNKLVELVDKMLKLNKQLLIAKTDQENEALTRQIDATDRKIDEEVYKLYGLTSEEIKIVEG